MPKQMITGEKTMLGKKVLVTGGTSGIGRATAVALAEKGAEVIIAGRELDKVMAAVQTLEQENGLTNVSGLHLNLASFADIRSAVEKFQHSHHRLDVLINNAGVLTTDLRFTEDGFEYQFGVNHLGHFLLTQLLLDALHAAPDPRIINVSSIAYLHGKIDFNNLRGERGAARFRGMEAYARSKLANVLFTREFAQRHSGITANALHPGVVRTRLGTKHTTWYVRLLWMLWQPFMVSPERGAHTSVYLAEAPRLRGVTGQFFDQRGCTRRLSPKVCQGKLAAKLWDKSLRWVGI